MKKFTGFALAFALAVLTFGGLVSSQDKDKMDKMDNKMMNATMVDKAMVDRIIADWKPTPQEVARTVIAKYGMPQEATEMRLVWHNNGPWKRTELVNEEIPHLFPKQHPIC
jgi:hypothetical protein